MPAAEPAAVPAVVPAVVPAAVPAAVPAGQRPVRLPEQQPASAQRPSGQLPLPGSCCWCDRSGHSSCLSLIHI